MKLPFAKFPMQDVEPDEVKWPTVDYAHEAAKDVANSRRKKKDKKAKAY